MERASSSVPASATFGPLLPSLTLSDIACTGRSCGVGSQRAYSSDAGSSCAEALDALAAAAAPSPPRRGLVAAASAASTPMHSANSLAELEPAFTPLFVDYDVAPQAAAPPPPPPPPREEEAFTPRMFAYDVAPLVAPPVDNTSQLTPRSNGVIYNHNGGDIQLTPRSTAARLAAAAARIDSARQSYTEQKQVRCGPLTNDEIGKVSHSCGCISSPIVVVYHPHCGCVSPHCGCISPHFKVSGSRLPAACASDPGG